MSDGSTCNKRHSICKFLVKNLKRTVFLYSLDTLDILKTTNKVFKILDNAIEAVTQKNLVQVVVNNAENFKIIKELLMQKMRAIVLNSMWCLLY